MIVTLARTVDELLAVVNARHGPAGHWHSRVGADEADHDHLRRPADAVGFLADHDVNVPATPPSPAALAALGILARDVRALASRTADGWPTPSVSALVGGATYRLDPDGMLASAAVGPWARLVDDLAAAGIALGQVCDDLRVCDNPSAASCSSTGRGTAAVAGVTWRPAATGRSCDASAAGDRRSAGLSRRGG